jgi:hypothetical protein
MRNYLRAEKQFQSIVSGFVIIDSLNGETTSTDIVHYMYKVGEDGNKAGIFGYMYTNGVLNSDILPRNLTILVDLFNELKPVFKEVNGLDIKNELGIDFAIEGNEYGVEILREVKYTADDIDELINIVEETPVHIEIIGETEDFTDIN